MKTQNDPVGNRRNIPVKFMDYIAQKHGYETFAEIKRKKDLEEIASEIKQRFTSTVSSFRLAYGDRNTWYKGNDETPFDFVKRVDQAIKDIKTNNDEKE